MLLKKTYLLTFLQSLWVVLLLLISLWSSWYLLAQQNFLYKFWYDNINIKEHIEKYAPQNKYRSNFEKTTKEERVEAFSKICVAIQNDGNGLKDITYLNGNKKAPLLHKAEIIHLQDVANLVTYLENLFKYVLVIWLVISIIILYQKQLFPSLKKASVILLILSSISILILLVFGIKEVFYQLHIWVFPENHQWFFYYQESLMATLMKAPDLFGYIALILVVFSFLIFFFIIYIFYKLSNYSFYMKK